MSILKNNIIKRHGFIKEDEIQSIIAHNPNTRVLVKCSCCRFICDIQYLERLVGYVKRDEEDFVRSVELTNYSDLD